MLIECPRCRARYQVAEGLIGPAGKSVRCAKCGNVWLARGIEAPTDDAPLQWPETPGRPGRSDSGEAPSPDAAAPPAAEDPALAEFRAAQDEAKAGFARFPEAPASGAPPRRGMATAAVIGWVATFLVLGAAGWGAYTYREAVMQAWPPSERVYLALGLRP
jgi:predicted Zn finger-like uncharacterized protein